MQASELIEQMALEKVQMRQTVQYLQQLLLLTLAVLADNSDVVKLNKVDQKAAEAYSGFALEQQKSGILKFTLHRAAPAE